MLTIIPGIPIPHRGHANHRGELYETLTKMKKGDYIEVDQTSAYICTYAKRYAMRVTTRKLDSGLLGVWCLKSSKLK